MLYCGICHSDLSMLDNEWKITGYPFVPGHKVVGRISALGENATHLKPGTLVELGWHCAISATPVGSPATLLKMVDFAACHQIAPQTDTFPMAKVNEAFEILRSKQPAHRIVLINEGA